MEEVLWPGLDEEKFGRVAHAIKGTLNIVYGEVERVAEAEDWLFFQLYEGRYTGGKNEMDQLLIAPDGHVVFRTGHFSISMSCDPIAENLENVDLLAAMIASAHGADLPEAQQVRREGKLHSCWDFTPSTDA